MCKLKKILVTGGTGLVGSHLLLQLVYSENELIAIYRTEESIEKTRSIFSAFGESEQFQKIKWKQADVNDYYALADAFESIDQVYHTAAKVSFHQYDAEEMMSSNIGGTANIVNLCLEHKVKKMCYVSSVAALGESKNGDCVSEDNDWINSAKTSNYSISKYYAENEVWRGSEEGLEVVVVNPVYILGYGNWNESSLQIFRRVYQGLSYFPSGSNGFVDIEDVVTVMIKLMNSNIINERYLLCSENLNLLDVFQIMSKAFGKKPPKLFIPKRIAFLAYWLDQVKSRLLRQKPILTKESLNSAYTQKCYDSSKVKIALDFSFKSIDQSITEASQKYLENISQQ